VYRHINSLGTALMNGITEAAHEIGINLQVSGLPSAFHTCFSSHPIHDYAAYTRADAKRLGIFLDTLLAFGVRPTGRGTWFVSAAHTAEDIASTLHAVRRALPQAV
jgi:glutamate-1-semialdehyde 2,1-aminomutase